MLIFFDTEFTDLHPEVKLMSIGLAAEDGREFYAELSGTYEMRDVGNFAIEAVLPLLEGGDCRMPMETLTQRLGDWIRSFAQPVKLATDSLSWDWPWIQEIFYPSELWPTNLDGKPLLLTMNYLPGYDQFCQAVERGFANGLRRHHALDDAKANRLGWIACGGDVATILRDAAQ